MAKTLLLEEVTGAITPGSGNNSFDVINPTLFKCVRVEDMNFDDVIHLMHRNYADDGWVPYKVGGSWQLDKNNTTLTPIDIGTYALSGIVQGTITAYTEE